MRGIISFIVLLIPSVSAFAVERDSTAKKQRVIYYIGLGVNTNQFRNDNFHYYYDPNGRDAVIQDYDISVSKLYSPFLQIGGYKTVLNKGRFDMDIALNDMIWLTQEKYKVKGTETWTGSGLVESVERTISTKFISNSLSANFSFLYNSSPSRIGIFVGTGLNYFIFYKSINEGYSLTFNTSYVDKNEGYNDNFKFKSFNQSKPVLQYDLNNNFIKEWKSAKEASEHLYIQQNSISLCCRNKRKKAGNFNWKFKNNKNE